MNPYESPTHSAKPDNPARRQRRLLRIALGIVFSIATIIFLLWVTAMALVLYTHGQHREYRTNPTSATHKSTGYPPTSGVSLTKLIVD